MTEAPDQPLNGEFEQEDGDGVDGQSDRREVDSDRRRSELNRRCGLDRRRQDSGPPDGQEDRRAGLDRRGDWDRRRGPGRRRSDERRDAEEGQMNDEQFEFIMAIDNYKRANNRPFPTYTEILEILRALGYRKVAAPQPLKSHKKAD